MIYKFIHNPFEGFGKINSSKTYTEDELSLEPSVTGLDRVKVSTNKGVKK